MLRIDGSITAIVPSFIRIRLITNLVSNVPTFSCSRGWRSELSRYEIARIENLLELVETESPLELVRIKSSLKLVGTESPLELVGTETLLWLVKTESPLELVGTESSLELVEHYYSGSALIEHYCLGSELAEHCCLGFGLVKHYCSSSGLVEHYCSGSGLVEHCCSGVELAEHCLLGFCILATLGPPSSTKNGVKLYVVDEESTRLGSAHVRKLIRVDQEEAGKFERGQLGLLGNTPWLGLLGSVPQAPHSRGLLRDPARRLHRGAGARCGLSEEQVKFYYTRLTTDMILYL
ncbi:hypothetical protein B296_00002894 [Ensete ventricosum]|uniref:Uncharacterized protein n=1 Tax=Ensete ventricosum TaxID=4639 RepID=A0A427B0X2_ENSVE|nr:hypothetical protein B296_00002894 [Ensete ventricosum]